MKFQFQKIIRFNLDVDFQKIQDMVIKDISEIYEEFSWDTVCDHFADDTIYYLEKLFGIEFGDFKDDECGEKILLEDNEEVMDYIADEFYNWMENKYEPKK
jgi:hypothetical protein